MGNSNVIRKALVIMNRVYELRTAGLKLKENKESLRAILIDLRDGMPAQVLVNVESVIKRRSGRDFFNCLNTAIYCTEACLRVAEQMDGYHAEALAINDFIDNVANACTDTDKQDAVKWLLQRVGIPAAKAACERQGIKGAYYLRAIEEAEALEGTATITIADGACWSATDGQPQNIVKPGFEEAHIEAVNENRRFDWLRARFGVFHVTSPKTQQLMIAQAHEEALLLNAQAEALGMFPRYERIPAENLCEGMLVRTQDGVLEVDEIVWDTDNTLTITLEGRTRQAYPHTLIEVQL